MKKWLSLLSACLFLWACESQPSPGPQQIVCTTGILGDATKVLLQGVDSLEVQSLMGPGTDPHLYKATQSDVLALSRARLIIYHGLHLEGKMNEVFKKLPADRVYAAAEVVPKKDLINASDYTNAYDPHIWFDLNLWSITVEGLSQRLQKEFPQKAAVIARNSKDYQAKLKESSKWALNKIAEIPEKQRVLITAHDAFKYFGQAYGLEVEGLQGISTSAEYGVRDISNLANLITAREIKAVFIENSVDPRAIEAVMEAVRSRGGELALGGELYSDALGAADGPAGDFLGMFTENVETIYKALR